MRLLILLIPLLASTSTIQIQLLQNQIQPQFQALNQPITPLSTWSWDNCGLPTDTIQLSSITISPDPPSPGQTETVTIPFSVSSTITEGAYIDMTVKVGLIKVLQKRSDFCDDIAKDTNLACPLEPGEYELKKKIEIPKETPPAKFTVVLNGYTAEDDDMMCLNVKADFTRRA